MKSSPEKAEAAAVAAANEVAAEVHRSVLLEEAVAFLALEEKRGGIFVDATLGLGGHSEAILRAAPAARVIGIDRDREAVARAERRLAAFGERFRAFHANFSEIGSVLERAGIERADGVLADLGVSSLQLDSPARGFSFRFGDAPLDMRMNAAADDAADDDDETTEETAAELLERLSEFEIARIIYEYGEERFSRRIARRIVERRESGASPQTAGELAELVAAAIPAAARRKEKIHPATRTFQALRIAVNGELEILEDFLRTAIEKLNGDGRIAVISFHSLEDRIVKHAFQKMAGKCVCPPNLPRCDCGARKVIEILTRKPVTPAAAEIAENPRARSAKLRAARKLV